MSDPKDPKKSADEKAKPKWPFPIWYILLTLVLLWIWQQSFSQLAVTTIPYSEFKDRLRRGEVVQCSVKEDVITGKITPIETGGETAEDQTPEDEPAAQQDASAPEEIGAEESPTEPFLFRTVRVEDPKLVEELEKAKVQFVGVQPNFLTEFFLAWALPIGLMIVLWLFIARRMSGAGQSMLSIGKSRARLVVDRNTGVKFGDVAGCDEAKFELQEVVDFLKNPARYQSLGAKIPKGVLLVGPPGTGKTLLARAVAGEASVSFFSISGSDFVEMFVGVGAARVRDLFQQAKNQAPCLIFIDELDAIGRQRGVHVGAVNDEREQTLNQLLVEMDGFEANTGVILLAATNRPEVLDRALLRPGRFDRQVVVDAPDIDGREAILRVHVRDKPLAAEVNLRRLAQATPGFSGADLANAINEAALLAARRQVREIGQRDLEEAIEKVVAGPERKSRRLNEDEKRRVAFHEVGHALVAAYSRFADTVHKISIVPRGRAALGYTMQLPADEQFLMTRSELIDRITGLLGGRASEAIVFGEITTGAQNDLERATALARQMVCLYGMTESVGLANCAQRPPAFASPADAQLQRDCSEETARLVDQEVKRILDDAYSAAQVILKEHQDQLEEVTHALLERETISGHDFYSMIGMSKPPDRSRKPGPAPAPWPAGAARVQPGGGAAMAAEPDRAGDP